MTSLKNIKGFVDTLDKLEGKKFGCIYADPPWKYTNQGTRANADKHYDTLSVDDICKWTLSRIKPSDLAAEKCHLHMWTTNAFLFSCQKIFESWGFEFKSSFIWVKPQMGIGNYWRNAHEFLLLGVRGGLTANDRSLISWIESKRTTHSSKPEIVRSLIERMSPGPYLELFGRHNPDGWTVFGNECKPTNKKFKWKTS